MNHDLQKAAQFYRNGDRLSALYIFRDAVTDDPNNINAWYGLALCVDAREQKIECLNRILKLNPNHEKAKQLLNNLQNPINPPNNQFQPPSIPVEHTNPPRVSAYQQEPAPGWFPQQQQPVSESNVIKSADRPKKPAKQNLFLWLGGAASLLGLLVVFVVVFGVIRANKAAAAFKEDFDAFYKEANKLAMMTEQGVNMNDFGNQLVEVKSSYAMLDGQWTSKYINSKDYYDKAIEGWDLTLKFWKLRYAVNTDTASLSEIDEYYGMKNRIASYLKMSNDDVDMLYFTDEVVGNLMTMSSGYFDQGESMHP